MSLQAKGFETVLVPLQLLLGTGKLLLEATAVQLMVLGASFRHGMEKGFSSVGPSPGYEGWAFLLGSTQEECLEIKSLNRSVQDKNGVLSPLLRVSPGAVLSLSLASVWTKAEQSKALRVYRLVVKTTRKFHNGFQRPEYFLKAER